MPRVSPILTNFTAGEWSPQLYGRVDLQQYMNACRTMKNFVPRVHGGAQFRPGTTFIAECKDSTKKARLIPFQYSTSQAYVIEAGDEYMRFFKDKGVIVSAGTTPYEIATPFAIADIPGVRFTQDKDLMYLFHRDYYPQKLTRLAHANWQLANANFENGPYLPANAAEEVGTNLITNGDMEDDSDWAAISGAAPYYQGRSDDYKYKDTYAWQLVDNAADKGFQGTVFSTVTDSNYRFRFRVYTAAGTLKIKIRKGDDSGWLYEETITGIPVHVWTEYERVVKETAGGSGAYVAFLTALTASVTGYASEYPPAQSQVYVKATTDNGASAYPYYATDPTMPLDGDASGKSWVTDEGVVTNQRFHIDLGEAKIIRRIYYENYHSGGGYESRGAKNFTLWGSNSSSAFENLTYGTDTGWTEITLAANVFDFHAHANAADPKYILVTATDKYRYYALKIADNYGSGDFLGFRRIELQDAEWDTDPNIYFDEAELYKVNSTTLTPSAKTGSGITLTASDALFEAGHVGAFFQLTHSTTVGYCVIKSITSATVAVADVVVDFGDTTATSSWREGAWSTKNGFPACGAFYEQRLVCGSSENDPDTLWGSKVTEYEDFTPGTAATDSWSYKLQSDIVRWIAAMGQLVVGTVNREFRLGAQGSGDALTPTNVKLTSQSRKGSADIMPIDLGSAILFAQRHGKADQPGRRVLELTYNYIYDSYDGKELTLLAEHITGAGIVDWALMSAPYQILWCVTEGGVLIGLTYEKEQNVIAWHRHETDGLVESVCVIPGENQDELWMVVNRTIGGVTKRYIEVMADFDWGTDQADCFFVDCGLTYDSTPATSFSGLDHLEGETVAILADGVVQDQQVVTSGGITLAAAASVVHAGLPYNGVLAPLDLDGGAMEGTGQGKMKRLHGVAINFYKTLGGYVGADEVTMEELDFPDADTVPQPLYSGIKDDFNFPADWALEGRIVIKQSDPLPMTVLSIMPRYRTEDR